MTDSIKREGRTKLTEADVRHIRQLYFQAELSLRVIAEKFDVTKTQIHNIVRGKQWRDVK